MVAAVDVGDFDFELPDELIAQEPPAARGASRLLVLDRRSGSIEHARFTDLGRFLRAGDLLVLNDTRVFPARLLGTRVPSGGAVECLLVRRIEHGGEGRPEGRPLRAMEVGQDDRSEVWEALMHPGQKLKPGARVIFEG